MKFMLEVGLRDQLHFFLLDLLLLKYDKCIYDNSFI